MNESPGEVLKTLAGTGQFQGFITSDVLAQMHGVALVTALVWLRKGAIKAQKIRGIWLVRAEDAMNFKRPKRGRRM